MKIIGIDPGLAATGIGIITGNGTSVEGYSYGSLTTSSKDSLPDRLNQIYSKLLHILEDEKPGIMIIEDIFSLAVYPKTGISLGKVSGVILLAGNRVGVPAFEVSVRETKEVLTGNGNAGKVQVERAVRNLLNVSTPIKPNHASDAIALALVGMFRYARLGLAQK
ncbi:MAG: crossover junction endodeoxyribonuclease RuvC [Desulfobacterales bacterium]|nr:crossover junction endodeoxyribonuclease RuvC [Desulfobacterales bacterium]